MVRRITKFLYKNQVCVDTYDRLFVQGDSVLKSFTFLTILIIGTSAVAGVNYNDPNLNGTAGYSLYSNNQSAFSDGNMNNINDTFTQLASAMTTTSFSSNDMSGFSPLSGTLGDTSKPTMTLEEFDDDVEK